MILENRQPRAFEQWGALRASAIGCRTKPRLSASGGVSGVAYGISAG